MNTYLIIILSIIIVDYILDIVVDTLNVKHVKTDLPKEFEGYYDAEKYKKAQNYLKENTRFGIIVDSIITPITVAFILIGGFNYVDQIARGFHISPIPTGLVWKPLAMWST